MQLGVNDYESQSERMNEALGKAIAQGGGITVYFFGGKASKERTGTVASV